MNQQHVIHSPFPITFAGSTAIITGLQNLIAAIALLGGGDFFGASASGTNLFTFVAGVLTLLAVGAILRALWRSARSTPAASLSTGASLRELYVAYWGLVLVLVLSAVAVTSLSESTNGGRYLIAAWVAVAALLGILATTQAAQAVILAAVSLFGVLNIRAELASGVTPAGPGPNQRLASEIKSFVTAHGATIGYSGYWDSTPVTWETNLQVKVFPLEPCAAPTVLCGPPYLAYINTWYLPRPNVRSFLLTDTRPNIPFEVTAPPRSLGRPLAQATVGKGLTIYVYNYDIAANTHR
jgi:hypothetical protein